MNGHAVNPRTTFVLRDPPEGAPEVIQGTDPIHHLIASITSSCPLMGGDYLALRICEFPVYPWKHRSFFCQPLRLAPTQGGLLVDLPRPNVNGHKLLPPYRSLSLPGNASDKPGSGYMKPGDSGAVGFATRTLLKHFHEIQSPTAFYPVNPCGFCLSIPAGGVHRT
jgi:hypothetical protein